MTKDEDFKLLKIQTYSLRVSIHCEGCNKKVKKLLQRIEGVYHVKVEAEHQKVTVSGSVDSTTLINKLLKAGKHAELWSPSPNTNPNQPQKPKTDDVIKNTQKGQKQGTAKSGLETFKPKNNPKGAACVKEEEDEDAGEEQDGEVQLPKPVNQQQQTVKKNSGGGQMNNGNNGVNASKKVNQKQNIQNQNNTQAMAAAMRMRNSSKVNSNVENNEIGALMGLAGFNGAATNAAVNPQNGIQQLQAPPLNNINSVTNHNGNGGGGMMMNMNGYNNHHAMNMQNRPLMHHHQPQQMMYQRPAFVPPSSNGYYYNYTPSPYTYYPYYPYPPEQHQHISHSSATNMSSDEDTSNNSSCNVM
ncbi:hypothetical protein N665_0772s0029 [Sinapis alba]|nr:hypothetical protein N665_0772s0029 [Sinapis alba]